MCVCVVCVVCVCMCVCVCVCVCDLFRKDTKVLGTFWKKGVPIEVVPMAYRPIQNKIVKELGGKCDLRMANRKAVRHSYYYMNSISGTQLGVMHQCFITLDLWD